MDLNSNSSKSVKSCHKLTGSSTHCSLSMNGKNRPQPGDPGWNGSQEGIEESQLIPIVFNSASSYKRDGLLKPRAPHSLAARSIAFHLSLNTRGEENSFPSWYKPWMPISWPLFASWRTSA